MWKGWPCFYGWGWDMGGVSQLWRAPTGVGSKPQAKLLSPAHQNQIEHNIQLWKATGFLSFRERGEPARDRGTLLKGECIKFCSQLLTLDSWRGMAEWSRSCEESLCFVALGGSWGTAAGIPVLSHFPILRHLSWVENSCPCSISWGETILPPSRLPLIPLCGSYTLLRSATRNSLSDWA